MHDRLSAATRGMWQRGKVSSPSDSSLDRGPFRPWGWPAVNGGIWLVFTGAALQYATWLQIAFIAPVLIYQLIWGVLGMCIRLSIDDTELRWRTLIGRGSADLRLVATVRHGPGFGWSRNSVRIVEIADGQRVRVCAGVEFDRFLLALTREVADVTVDL